MARSIVFGIDGTDPYWFNREARDKAYDQAFANSFVKRICDKSSLSKYMRGPLIHGGNLIGAINTGIVWIQQELQCDPTLEVLLCGYSRGAAGAVVIGQQLERANIPIKAMMLFDCVDRCGDIDSMVISKNVKNVRHARRDPDSSSRETMGNSGYKYYSGYTKYEERYFMCTHAGMGGTPWPMGDHHPHDLIFESGMAKPKLKLAHANSRLPMPEIQDAGTTISYKQDHWVSANKVWPWVEPWLKTQGFMR
jgi:hypothetical protein